MDYKKLANAAREARKLAYVPYSGFRVGAALLIKNGEIILGCNIENAAYSPTNCAERTAFFAAIAAGHRDFKAIAVAGWSKEGAPDDLAYPCGVCRQVMMEFCEPQNFEIIIVKRSEEKEIEVLPLYKIMPYGFGPSNLN